MTPEVIHSLPREKLLFYVAQPITPEIRETIRAFVPSLGDRRAWILGAPKLVEMTEDLTTRDDDEPVETLGGVLEVCSANLPAGLPRELDASFYGEVRDLVEAVRQLSDQKGLSFEFIYGQQFVGEIEDGEVDRMLQVGLLDEWRKHLNL